MAKNDAYDLTRKWEILSHADHILHSRIQTNAIAQSFLVGACAILLTSPYEAYANFMGIAVGLLAFTMTTLMMLKGISIERKMERLNSELRKIDPIFNLYMNPGIFDSDLPELVRKHNPYVFWISQGQLVFWFLIIVMWVVRVTNRIV